MSLTNTFRLSVIVTCLIAATHVTGQTTTIINSATDFSVTTDGTDPFATDRVLTDGAISIHGDVGSLALPTPGGISYPGELYFLRDSRLDLDYQNNSGSNNSDNNYIGVSGQGRWADSADISLKSANLAILGGKNQTNTETVGAVNFAGVSTLTVEEGNGSGKASLTIDSLGRNGKGVLLTDSNGSASGDFSFIKVNSISNDAGGMLAPYIVARTASNQPYLFTTHDATDGITAIATTNINGSGTIDGAAATDNVEVTSGTATMTVASKTVNSVQITGGTNRGLDLNGGTLDVVSGGLLSSGKRQSISDGTIRFGSGGTGVEGVIMQVGGGDNSNAWDVDLVGDQGLTIYSAFNDGGKRGLELHGDNSGLTGNWFTVWNGRVQISSSTAMPATTGIHVGDDARLDLEDKGTTTTIANLKGHGRVWDSDGDHTLTVTGTVSPGDSVGHLRLGDKASGVTGGLGESTSDFNLVLGGGSTFEFEVNEITNGSAGADIGWDLLSVDGSVAFDGLVDLAVSGVDGFEINEGDTLDDLLFLQAEDGFFDDGGQPISDGDVSSFFNLLGGTGSVELLNNELFLSFAPASSNEPVPEPASIAIWTILGFGLAALGYLRHRRTK